MVSSSTPYVETKIRQKETGIKRIADLLAMDPKNDPFYSGQPADVKAAEWFMDIWRMLGYDGGVHLRRIHYQVVSLKIDRPYRDGTRRYDNVKSDWQYLQVAAAHARYMGLLDPEKIEDHRTPSPDLNSQAVYRRAIEWEISWEEWVVPSIDISMDLTLPTFESWSYQYGSDRQPWNIEIWVEKSTQNDILEPICRRRGVNLVTGIGFMTVTSVVDLIKRVERGGKPTVIFYISDFDPAGEFMPRQVARQAEFWGRRHATDQKIVLEPLILTKDQVMEYDLPPLPVDEKEKTDDRIKFFLDRYGVEGPTELDALEALHPGELARIVNEAIDLYQDKDLERKFLVANAEARKELQQAWDDVLSPYEDQVQNLEERIREVGRKHIGAFNAEVEHLLEELKYLQQAFEADLAYVRIDLPPLPETEVQGLDRPPYFDSSREYMEQLRYYKNLNGDGA